jgi:hypothetical protein
MNTESGLGSAWERSLTRRLLLWLVSWRTVRGVLLGAVGVVTLVVMLFAVVNWRGARAWEAHRRVVEGRGGVVDFVALSPPLVADSQNLAMAPMVHGWMDYTRSATGLVWNQPESAARIKRLTMSAGNVFAGDKTAGRVDEGTFTDFEGRWREVQGGGDEADLGGSAEAARRLRAALAEADPVLDELAAAANERPYTRFPVEYGNAATYDILLPHLASMRGLHGLIVSRAVLRLETGEVEGAFTDLQLGFRLADGVKREPLLISYLVRIAMVQRNLQVIREGLRRGAWRDAELASLQGDLGGLGLLEGYRLAMEGERAAGVTLIDWLRRKRNREQALDGWVGGEGSVVEDCLGGLVGRMPSGWYYRNMVWLSGLHEQFTFPMVDVEQRRVDPRLGDGLAERLQAMPTRPSTVFVKLLMPSVSRLGLRTGQAQTLVDAARVGCGLERYRLAMGRSPEALGLLVPRFLDSVPLDVIDGRPLRYLGGEGDGYRLYGVGWNGVDDGGVVGWAEDGQRVRRKKLDPAAGDWVWWMPGRE